MINYIQSKKGNTECLIDITVISKIQDIKTSEFIKNYKISNFFRGKFFIKRLINKIFKYKINKSLKWKKDFWLNIEILAIEIDINFSNQFKNISDFENHINRNFNTKRLNNIYQYKKNFEKNISMSNPLYISGECINYLGGQVKENEIFMLDGSRRLVAKILSYSKKNQIYLINYKK